MRDRQGKLRTTCTQCDCKEYQLPNSGNACDYCGHYPTAHAEGSSAPARQPQIQQNYSSPPRQSQPQPQPQSQPQPQPQYVVASAPRGYEPPPQATSHAGLPPGPVPQMPKGPKLMMRDTLVAPSPAVAVKSKPKNKRSPIDTFIDMVKDKRD